MFQNFISYLQYGNHFCGVEHASKNEENVIYATVLKKSKKEVDIENSFKEKSLEALISKLPKKQHICLIINNDNVLTKTIKNEQIEAVNLVYKAFQNINIEDFYYEIIQQNDNSFVSICRKTYVETLIETYTKNHCSIINISFGNVIASSISNLLDFKTLTTSNAEISIKNNMISTIEKKEKEDELSFNINGLQINNNHILSFSGALSSVLHHFNPTTNFYTLKLALKNAFKQTQFFAQFSKFGLILILSVLIINFFFFNNYFNNVNTLQQTSQINQASKQKVLNLNKHVSRSQKMVEDLLKSSASKSSFYLNAIIQSLPNSILLSELNYQPIVKRIKKEQSIEIENHIILISGKSNNSILYSEWISSLENTNWINSVDVVDYSDSKTAFSDFKIKIAINP